MIKRLQIIAVMAIVLAMLVVGAIASRIGGRSIRNNIVTIEIMSLSLSEPALRGVPVQVRWPQADRVFKKVDIYVRDAKQDTLAGHGDIMEGSTTVVIPCDVTTPATLVMRDSVNQAILATQAVTLLSAGPECIR